MSKVKNNHMCCICGAIARMLGFGNPGVESGSAAASMMSASWRSGVGRGLISSFQSAGATFGSSGRRNG